MSFLRTALRAKGTTSLSVNLATFGQRSLCFEILEDRRLLDAELGFTHIVEPLPQDAGEAGSIGPALAPLSSSSPVGFTITQIRSAYGVNSLTFGSITGNGTGQTIAIIDAYDDPELVSSTSSSFSTSDLHKFDVQMGLADPPSFTKLDENGGTNYPAPSGSTGWSVEESLDVEWAHAMAPGANIVLIEANSPSDSDLFTYAANTARNLAGVSVVSMSFGGSEFSGETAYDSDFTTPSGHQGVTFVASTGDDGAPGGYPAFSPNVVAVGGTTLTLSGNSYVSETGWSDSGGGNSLYESEPSYQNSVQTSTHREIPDVAFVADPNTGVAVYDSYDYGSSAPWVDVGGTSVAAPCWAGLLAVTNQARVIQGLGTLIGPSQTLPLLYGLPSSAFHDITSGYNGFSAGPGYDLVTGRGSPVAPVLVPDLASYAVPDLTVAASHTGNFKQGDIGDTLTLTVSNTGGAATSGTVSLVDSLPTGLTVTAMAGNGWTGNLSTLTFTRSDVLAADSSYPPITLTVNVATTAPVSATNSATVSGGGELNTTNDTASDVIAIQPSADLTIGVTNSSTFKQGDVGDTYTITVSNAGFQSTTGTVNVVDTLPAGLTATAITGAGWSVNLSTLTATRSDPLASGGSYQPLIVTVNVAANAASSLIDQAVVSGGGDTNLTNNTATDTTTVQQPDLSVAVTNNGTFTQGDLADSYTITVSNVGLSATNAAVSVVDYLPSGLTALAMAGAGWIVSLAALTATRSDLLAAGGSYPPLTLTVSVAANATSSQVDSATVSGGGEINTANDTGVDTTTIQQLPDLTVTSTHSGTFKQGDSADTYTITVTNSGSGSTSGSVTVVDSLPTGLTATAMSGTGWSVNLATLTATRSDALAAGSSYPAITLTVSVSASAATSLTNTATVSGGGELAVGNDIATDVTSILNAAGPPSIVSVTPSLNPGVLVAASTTTFTITFSEAVVGGGTASNYRLQSPGPDGELGTADDVYTALTASYTGNTATLTFAALTTGVYRLTVLDSIVDAAGNALAGSSGPASNYTRDFVVAPQQAGSFLGSASTASTGGSSPQYMVEGDFNGDGHMDLAVVNNWSNTVSIFLGNGNGTFAAAVTYSTGGTDSLAIATGDFTGNGKLDLAIANYDSNTVSILLGNGNGTFQAATTFSSDGSNPYAIAVADFNGDGKLDIAVTNDWSNDVAIFFGNGSGGFTLSNTYAVIGSFPVSLAVGDFNGDGHPDLAVGVAWANVDVLLNNGNGTFGAAVAYGPNTNYPFSIAVGDLNGDGKLDLAVANYQGNTVSVLLGNGNGTFATDVTYSTGGSEPYSVAIGDINDDGIPDIIVTNGSSNTVGLLLGNGNGTFGAVTDYSTGGSEPYGLAVADFNGDGFADVAAANESSGTIALLPRVFVPSTYTFTSPSGYTFDVQYAGDGSGQLVQGTANAFNGLNRLQVNGVDYGTASSNGGLANNGQSYVFLSQTMSGLSVSRNVTVPNNGSQDFARTVDSFQNTTASSITATVTIVGNLGSDAATTVFATSGTGVVSPNDEWIGTDDATDGGGTPAIINFIHGPAGLLPSAVSVTGDNISWTYTITVPAGQTTSLATFTIQNMSRATAVAEANALVTGGGFGGQAGLGMTTSQLAALANFQFLGPTAIQLSSTSVNEKQNVGVVVGNLSSTDTHSGATFTYSFPQSPGYPDNSAFAINASGQLVTAAVLNYQTQSFYTILIESTDQYGDWFTQPFTITVNNITPPSVVLDQPGTSGPSGAAREAFTVNFSEPVKNVTTSDFQITATGTASGVVSSVSAASGTSFVVTVSSITGNGTLRLDIPTGSTIVDAAGNVASAYAAGNTVAVDQTPPTILSSTPSTLGPTTATSLNFTVLFSETVYAVDLSDFQLTATGSAIGTLTGLSATSGTSIVVTVTGIDGAGTLRLDLKSGGTILDSAGNVALGYSTGSAVAIVDTPAAVTSIAPSTIGPTNATSMIYTAVFSKNVFDVLASDFELTSTGTASGTIASVSAVSGIAIYVTVNTITGAGTLRLDLNSANTLYDQAGIAVPGYTSGSTASFDHTPPAVLSDSPSTAGPTTASSVAFTVTFSKTVYNAVAGDFFLSSTGTATGTVLSISASSGTSLIVTVSQIDGAGTLQLDLGAGSTITDAAGNSATAYSAGGMVTILDTPAAVTSITPSTPGPTNVSSLNYTVAFTKNVYNIFTSDFQLTPTGTAAGTITSVSASSGSSVNVTVSSITGDGNLRLDLLSGSSIQDITGAPVPGFTSGGTTVFHHTPPAVLSSTPNTTGTITASSLAFTVVFSETVFNFAPADLQLTTTGTAIGTVSSVSASSGTSFTVTVTSLVGVGTLRLDLKTGTTIQDAAGNVPAGYTSGSTASLYVPVTVAPLTTDLINGILTAGATAIALGFSEAVLSGGTAGNFKLQSAGADGLLGTADDTTITLAASYTGTTTTLTFAGLAAGLYRLTAYDTITDTSGNALDGNLNGQAGSNWVRDFVVAPLNTTAFHSTTTVATVSTPYAVATGDFNGDGKLDQVVANYSTGTVTVILGDGTGGAVSTASYSTGGSDPDAVAVGDVNGDGKLDIVVANYGSNTIGVLLGNGAGGFASVVTYATGGSNPAAVALGDFNGDGKLDIAVANKGSGNVSILLNNGSGGFGTATTYATYGSSPVGLAVGDFNGDGKLDLAVANAASNSVSLLLGNGNGTFATARTFSSGGSSPLSLVAGDFNGDGKLDLAVANSSSNTVGILLGNGSGGFSAATLYSTGGSDPIAMAVGDVNGDGYLDLVVANYASNTVAVLEGNGYGGFAAATTYSSGGTEPQALVTGDFNGDGKVDIAVANYSSGSINILLNSTGGVFSAPLTFTSGGTDPEAVAVGDFNGDGIPDIVVANYASNTVSVMLGNGSGGFSYPTIYAVGTEPDAVAVGDFNGDGNLDIAVANYGSNTVSIFLGNGYGGFAPAVSYSTGGSGPKSLAVGDFNGDGKPDIVVSNYLSNTVGVLLNNGTGGFATATTFSSGGSDPSGVAIGDFNGDGNLDIAVANINSTSVGVLLGNGSGGFAAVTTFNSGGTTPMSLVTGDFNGDGKVDIAVANCNSNTVGVLLGNGAGGFAAVTTYATGGSYPISLVTGDFNGDGKPDLAVTNASSNTVTVLLGNGSGSFALGTTFSTGAGSQGLAVGDFNGDGKPDLAVANYTSGTVSVLTNTESPIERTLTSPTGTTYQVESGGFGAGQIAVASDGAYNGMGRLRVGGADYTPPLSTASLINSNDTVVTPAAYMSGLLVSRKVSVAASGSQDLVRTIDNFQNTSSSSITTTVQILGNLGSDAGTTIFATSDGTGVASPSDDWIGTYNANNSSAPAIITMIHGPLGLVPTTETVTGDNITWTYSLTVAVGQTIELGYYTIESATQAGAVAAANALVTPTAFGGHAADFLSSTDLGSLANFAFFTATAVTLSSNSIVASYGGNASVTAQLTSGGQPFANESLTFMLGGTTIGTATTNAAGLATLSNFSLAGVQVGAYANYLSVAFAGDTSHWQSSAAASLTINPAALLITANNKAIVAGTALPTFTATYTGFVSGDTAASLTTPPTFTTTATAASPLGSYSIVVSGAVDSDYSITYLAGTLTITTAPTVAAMLVENGMTERSYVDHLTFQFSKPVTGTAIPLTLTDLGTQGNRNSPVSLTASQFSWTTEPVTGASVLNWSLESFAAGTASLPDGYYQLRLPSSQISDAYGIPLYSNGQTASDFVAYFFVLQGDVNGDGFVNGTDASIVSAAMCSHPGALNWNPNADLDRDGAVTANDSSIVQDNLNDAIVVPVTPSVAAALPAWTFAGSTSAIIVNSLPVNTSISGITFTSAAAAQTLNGNAIELNGNLSNQSSTTQTINLPIVLNAVSVAINTGADDLAIAGGIGESSGGLGFTKTGSGLLVLSGTDTYSGTTSVQAGELQIDGAAALPIGCSLTIGTNIAGGQPFSFAVPTSQTAASTVVSAGVLAASTSRAAEPPENVAVATTTSQSTSMDSESSLTCPLSASKSNSKAIAQVLVASSTVAPAVHRKLALGAAVIPRRNATRERASSDSNRVAAVNTVFRSRAILTSVYENSEIASWNWDGQSSEMQLDQKRDTYSRAVNAVIATLERIKS